MRNIIYKARYFDGSLLDAMQDQEYKINKYIIENSNIEFYIEESYLLENLQSFDRKIDTVIRIMQEFDCLTISHLNILGQSVHRILKRMNTLYFQGCSLYIITNNIYIQPNDISDAMKLLLQMYRLSDNQNDQRKKAVKITLKSSGKKTGRVQGKKYKSKFDQYRSKIIKMDSKGISKKTICETIGIGTPQAIGKYIKSIKEKNLLKKPIKRRKSKKTYLPQKYIDVSSIGF